MTMQAPRRDDVAWYNSLLKENLFYKFTLAVLFLVILVLAGVSFILFNRKVPVYAFDSSTGRTYATQRITKEMWDNLLIAATRDFISDFLNYDYLYIERARTRAFARMSPVAQKKFKESLSNSQTILSVVKNHTSASIKFLQNPAVILRAGSEYRTFCMIEITIRNMDGTQNVKSSNWKISWLAMPSTPDRPDGLWVSDMEAVGDVELNEILNQIK